VSEFLKVHLSVGEFALPSPRTGSIDLYSGYGRSVNGLEDGLEIHQRVQKRRMEENALYEAEVTISSEFEESGYLFEIEGRMDGYTPSINSTKAAPAQIEEIKSAFNVWELASALKGDPLTHPYCLQLLTYGYFVYLKSGSIPDLSFLLVSSRNAQELRHELELRITPYEAWLKRRLGELVREAEASVKRAKRRIQASKKFPFPFESPRSGQIELIRKVEGAMKERKRLLVQAPTGLGKTVGVLYPSLKEALSRGQRVVYVTPKNSQHGVAEDAVERFQETGVPLKSLTITAKSKMCFKAEPLCNPKYCEFARDYYDKVSENNILGVLAKKKKLTTRVFKKLGEEFQVCPYELQMDIAHEADTVICDYNYVFAPRSALRRLVQPSFVVKGKPNLVIDEAHNLPGRAMSYYSPGLSCEFLESLRASVRLLPQVFAHDGLRLLDQCQAVIRSCRPKFGPESSQVVPDLAPFLSLDSDLREYLSSYLNSEVEIGVKDPVLRLCFYWSDFTEALEELQSNHRPEFFVTFQPVDTLRITCCDASEMLKPAYEEYSNVVGFSATLKPFDFYAKLSGLDTEELETAEFKSPFESSRRKLLIIPQISTKYSERERNYSRIAETISRVTALRSGNYFAFFPSFAFLERVASQLVPPPGFQLVLQSRGAKASEVENLLETLKNMDSPKIVLAVQGGVYSEGIDYPGKMLIGAFVIGPPLPVFDVEQEGRRKYYDTHYGKGFDYAYAYPATAKAVQAAGRVIRSENDQGVVILMDARFLEPSYVQSMPADWFDLSPLELVSKSILKDVSDFWATEKV
jgi:DNA excision repair protein ERCC-2